jgi:hypothetical protein|tara:strand:+ start:5110 stop:5571 length:462 start_codon:yes stop_codon:yes gene_type:complete
MIDPVSAFTAVSAASSAISSAIKAGKDLSNLSGPVAKYAKAEAELNFGASRKKKSLFSRMTGAEQAGIDTYFKKLELDQMRAQLREVITIHGKPGAWEALQAEIARQRQIQKDELERRAKVRDAIIMWTVLPVILIGGAALLYTFVMFLKGQQ